MTYNEDKLISELDDLEQMLKKKNATFNKNKSLKSQKKQKPVKETEKENKSMNFKIMGARLHPDLHRHLKAIIGLEGMSIQEYHCNYYEGLLKKHGIEQSVIDLLKLPVPGIKKS